ncbi:MAG: hypothetical protein EBZ09_11705, partial [Betaproteobacteria bacterium]|nr:hypothetical protein [Betaproteobacteria bacterium]
MPRPNNPKISANPQRHATRSLIRGLAAGLLASGLAWGLVGTQAMAQSASAWPGGKPIRLISPFPPGGTTDQLARLVAQPLSQALGTQVLVENRAGGNGSIGTLAAAKAPPDGHTFVFVFDTHATNPSLIPNIAYDTRNDLTPVMLIATGAMVIVAHKSQPQRSFSELVKSAKSSA